jgi:23S rRNA pseudouridine1911/1915/1917 synthase
MQKYVFQITEEDEGERIDRYLSALMDTLTRSYLQKLLKDELVLKEIVPDDFKPLKANYRVKDGDRIHLHVPEATIPMLEPEAIPLDILYEDEHLLVVNKPKGMVVHPAPGHYHGTLVNALLGHCRDSLSGINGVLRPGIVHRIDRDTTGAIIACKNDFAHQEIARQFKEHLIERIYLALVCGIIPDDEGIINAPIGRHPKERQKMTVLPLTDERGKEAVTHFRVVQRFPGKSHERSYTLVELKLHTGRTHQIRVHMKHLGFPVLGDSVYGNEKSPFKITSQALHAAELGFIHPATREYTKIEAPLPAYFLQLLDVLRD